MYFREFGIPARIARCYNVDQLEEKIKEYQTERVIEQRENQKAMEIKS